MDGLNPHTVGNLSDTAALLHGPGKRIAIIMHVNPDGDALGSSLGLYALLNKAGHHCQVLSPSTYPVFLDWMPGIGRVIIVDNTPQEAIEALRRAEIIFALDFNEIGRAKNLDKAFISSAAHKVLMDHHPVPDLPVDCLISDPSASSTAELVYRFIRDTGLMSWIDKEIASCLFTGIMTDTGCFSYNSSNRKTWETVAELIDLGIDKDRLYALTYDNFSAHRMRLLGFSLSKKMEIFPEYRTGIIWLSRTDLQKYNFEMGDTEGFVNYPLSVRGIRFSALFIEKEDHIRISFRSKGDFAVNEFSKKYFNGGGHANASGGESYLGLAATLKLFRAILPEYKDKLTDYEV